MAYNPGVSFFTPFHELDPSKENRCIFFTQTRKGERCKWPCQESDNRQAIALHETINAISSEAVSLDLLREYVLCNCCRSGNARHQDRIEDIGLLIPLARRWQDEIRSQPRYDLRPREANISTNSTSTKPTSISQPPLTEFRPHVAGPLHSHSVSRKILNPLEDRDFETGSLYIFNRASSPGHVKIGWTARSILRRLEDWSECGYTPNLLFSVRYVPHAQRVETLTHHELIKKWRRERECAGCGKSHQEWFEISEERAARVLGDWADFMKRAEPYDSEGWLKNWWREVVEMMDENEEVITAKKLLERYEESWVEEATLVEEPVDLGHAPKIEEVGFGYVPKGGRLETPLLKSEALPKQIPEKQPKSDQLFKTKTEPLSRSEPLSQTQPRFKSKLPCEKLCPAKTTPFNTEPAREEVSAPETTPVKELPPEQIPLPPSPLLQPTTFPQDTPGSRTGTEETSAIDIITHSGINITVVDASSNLKINSSVSPSAPASLSATPSEDIPPQTNTHTSTDTSTTNSPPLNFSDPSSEPNPSDSSATSAVTEISEALLTLSTDEQEELAETKSHNQDESTVTEKEMGTADGWDAEATLVEDQTSRFDELSNDISTGKANGVLKGLDGLKVLESEAPPAVEVVAQL
jgi:hypothetical protein